MSTQILDFINKILLITIYHNNIKKFKNNQYSRLNSFVFTPYHKRIIFLSTFLFYFLIRVGDLT